MGHLNIEFKAKCNDLHEKEQKLQTLNPQFIGIDEQTDTYFNVPDGRLKLREGNIENALIFYKREDIAGDKASHVILYKHLPDINLKTILQTAYGVKISVAKKEKFTLLIT